MNTPIEHPTDLYGVFCDAARCEEEWLSGKLANLTANEVEQTVDDNFKDPGHLCNDCTGLGPRSQAAKLLAPLPGFLQGLQILRGVAKSTKGGSGPEPSVAFDCLDARFLSLPISLSLLVLHWRVIQG